MQRQLTQLRIWVRADKKRGTVWQTRKQVHTSASGQSRRFGGRPTTSGTPRLADILRGSRHVSKVPLPDSCIAANCASFDHLVERAALMGRVTLHGLDQVGDQVVISSLGIPVAADSCDATFAASLNVELPHEYGIHQGNRVSRTRL